MLDDFLLVLFDKYAELLKKRFSEDFQEVHATSPFPPLEPTVNHHQIVSTDDYMPMAINSLQEYEKVVNVSWFAQDKPAEELTYAGPNFPHQSWANKQDFHASSHFLRCTPCAA
jgi:exocyst complex component 6